MLHLLFVPILLTLSTSATTVRGEYVEARTCDVFTGECFANADTGLTGKHAVMAWKIEAGAIRGTKLDGLGVVAVIAARETLGLKQSGPGRGIIIVDEKATKDQREALVAFAKAQTGNLLGEVLAIRTAAFDLTICECNGEGCATLKAGTVKLATRCIDATHDKACGNESTMYPPLAKGVAARAAVAAEHSYTGKELKETWNDAGRRGAYVGTFMTR